MSRSFCFTRTRAVLAESHIIVRRTKAEESSGSAATIRDKMGHLESGRLSLLQAGIESCCHCKVRYSANSSSKAKRGTSLWRMSWTRPRFWRIMNLLRRSG